MKTARDAYNVMILYEDNHVVCAVKPRGVLSQADGSDSPDMLTILKRYIKKKYNKKGEVYLGLVHRLDRPVGGVMVFARTSKAAGRLSGQIRERAVKKIYYAVLFGVPDEACGRLEHIVSKDRAVNIVKVARVEDANDAKGAKGAKGAEGADSGVVEGVEGGVADTAVADGAVADGGVTDAVVANAGFADTGVSGYACLEYRTLGSALDGKLSLIRVEPLTGRPHQIRAQFAHIGHPIVGDRKYGAGVGAGAGVGTGVGAGAGVGVGVGVVVETPALWAASFEFAHPVKLEPVVITAPPPDEFPWNLFDKKMYI